MSDFILHIGWLTLSMSLVILVVLLFNRFFGKRFLARSRYTVWILVVLSLCIGMGLFKIPSLFTFEVSMPSFNEKSLDVSKQPPIPDEVQPPISNTHSAGISTNPIAPNTSQNVNTELNTVQPNEKQEGTVPTVSGNPEKEPVQIYITAIIFVFWITGTVFYLAINLAVYIRSAHKYARTKKICSAETDDLFRVMCRRYKIKRIPRIYVCSEVGSPVLYGYTKPTILIPEIELTKNSLVGVLAHELTHYRRGDIWIKFVCLLTESMYWFNPLVYIATKRCNAEMELSCDETVLVGMNEDVRRSYGSVMLDIVEHCSCKRNQLTTQFNPHKNAVKERLMNILDMTKKKHGRVIIAATLVLCIVAGTFIGCAVKENNGKIEGTVNTIKSPTAYNNLSDFLGDEQIAVYETASILYPMFQGMPTEIDNLHLSLLGADADSIIAYLADLSSSTQRESYTTEHGTYHSAIGEYNTHLQLEELCLSVFTRAYFDKLNRTDEEYSIFKDIDGKLYYLYTSKGGAFGYVPDEYPDTYELISRSDTEICFNVIGYYKSSGGGDPIYSVSRYAFPITMILQDDGWRFSRFAYAGISNRDINKPEEVVLKSYFGKNSIDELMELSVIYQNEEISLGDWFKKYEFSPIKYTTIDLNNDWASEMVFGLAKGPNGENEDVGSLILHSEGDTVYAYILFYREFNHLKSDGTFEFSGSVSNGGIGKLSFTSDTYMVNEIVSRKSEDNQNLSYYIENQSVSKEEYDTYIAEQDQKSEAAWEIYKSND